nr:MAG TPA: hypothetical protein [Caudoviricetes sp.]
MPVIQAFADGKDVETKTSSGWISIENMSFAGNPDSYRIKPEPKYRSFKNAEECWQEMQKHQPFGYTYDRFNDIRDCITKVATTGVSYDSPTVVISFEEVFDRFVFADGVPFGVKLEE